MRRACDFADTGDCGSPHLVELAAQAALDDVRGARGIAPSCGVLRGAVGPELQTNMLTAWSGVWSIPHEGGRI